MDKEKIEEAKERLKILKDTKKTFVANYLCNGTVTLDDVEKESIETILQYIDELEWTLNKYGGKEQLEKYIWDISKYLGDISIDCFLDNIKENYIPKQKIKDKIEYYEEWYDRETDKHVKSSLWWRIKSLKEFVEE